MNRIMLDLETLDTGPRSTILSIGAVRFTTNILDMPYWDNFYVVVKPNQSKWGRTISADTVFWWLNQSDAARGALTNGKQAIELDQALNEFAAFATGPGNVDEMWGNGADFDNVILGSAFADVDIKRPWSYGRNRCFRTLKNIGIKLPPGAGIERHGTHHNALDDAMYQAAYAAVYLRRLEDGMGQ